MSQATVTVNRVALQTAISQVKAAVPNRTPKDVLFNVHFNASETGIVLTATDLKYAVEYRMKGKVLSPGSFLLNADKLSRLVSATSSESLTIKVKREGVYVSTTANDEFRFGWVHPELFPLSKEEVFRPVCDIDPDPLRWAVRTCGHYANQTHSSYNLQSIQCLVDETYFRTVSTDGRAICVLRQEVEKGTANKDVKWLFEGNVLKFFAGLEGETANIAMNNNRVRVHCGNATVECPQVEGKFPRYEDILQGAIGRSTCRVNAADLMSKLREADLFRSENRNFHRFDFRPGVLTVSIESETGSCSVSLPVECDCERTVRINLQVLMPFLQACGEDDVAIKMTDPKSSELSVRIAFLLNEGEGILCVQNCIEKNVPEETK